MSHHPKLNQIANSGEYTVSYLGNCRIVRGPVPVKDLMMLTSGFAENAEMDIGLADRIGASLVIGHPEDLVALRQRDDLPVSEERQAAAYAAQAMGLTTSVAEWLLTGERGRSSDALCKAIFGFPQAACADHPHDPSDLRRCILFLEKTGSRGSLYRANQMSSSWAALVKEWDALESLYVEERHQKSAPKTYDKMQKILKGAGEI